MAGSTVTVTDATFADEVEQSDKLTLVDFWAAWCGPCRAVAPVLDQIAAERANQVKVAKLDVDENTQTATRFNVRSIPTLLFFKEGKVVGQIVGAAPRSSIESAIAQLA